MSSPILTDEARSFYKIFKEIRIYLNQTPSISDEDRKNIAELLRVLKYKIQFDILKESIENDNFITCTVADIDTKLLQIDKERKKINDSIKDMQLVTGTKRLIALRRTSDELDRIRTYISNREFNFYIDAMNAEVKSTNELIAVCNQVLRDGEEEYATIFGNPLIGRDGVSKAGIDLLFSIMTDGELRWEHERYLKVEDKFLAIQEEKDNNSLFLKLIDLSKKNEVAVREYLKLRVVLNEQHLAEYEHHREDYATKKLVLANLSTTGITGVLNKRQRDPLAVDILSLETAIKDHEEKVEEVKKLESILKNIGLGEVVDSLNNAIEGDELTVYDKVAAYLKASVKRYTFDVKTAHERIEARNKALDKKLDIELMYVNDSANGLSNKAHKLITLYHDDVVKMFNLFKVRSEHGFSPVLAAYILKALCDARNLDYREINEISCMDLDIEQLFKIYAEITQAEVKNIQESLMDVQNQEDEYSQEYYESDEYQKVRNI